MAKLSNIQSVANVKSSFTYLTDDVFDEEDIQSVKAEIKASKSKKWCRTIGAIINESACTLEKAKSYSVKGSANIAANSIVITIFCNAEDSATHKKAHESAICVDSLNEALAKAKNDVA